MDILPELFKEKMKKLLKDEYDDFEACYYQKHHCGLRINTLKLSPEGFKALSPYELEPVPWIKNGFYYDSRIQPARHPYYYAGLYYIQEPSAMTPASLLPVVPGDRVLDLCAAPGGKSTELGAKLMGRGLLLANDISNSRAKALLKNIEMFGIMNAVVVSEPPSRLADYFEGYFDKVLVDAPCSGEGMFRKSHAVIKNWEQYGVEYYNRLQREILPYAVKMLKPGGYMIYSTCTFSPEEDEGTLRYILENFPDMHAVPAADLSTVEYEGFRSGEPELAGGEAELGNAIRIYPHLVRGEGHFVALLRKDGDTSVSAEVVSCKKTAVNRSRKDISNEAYDFLERLDISIDADRLFVRDGRLFLLPEGLPELKGLRVMRSGLLLGEMKKNRFEPSQALAGSLKMGQYDNVYSLSSENPDTIRYLKCESITIPEGVCRDGWVLVCADGFPMGWGKISGGSFKNKYLPGWRWV